MVQKLEEISKFKANICWEAEQPGDVKQTWADVTKASKLINYNSNFSFDQGLQEFVKWFKEVTDE